MYHFQRQIIEEAKKYNKPPLDGSTEAAMANLDDVDLMEGSTQQEEAATIVANNPINKGTEDINKRTAEMLKKYRVPPSFISDYGKLRKKKEMLPGSRIMWSRDDRDLDVIPAKDIQTFQKDGWVIIEGVMSMGNDDFVIARNFLTE